MKRVALAALLLLSCKRREEERYVQRNVGVLCVGAPMSDAQTAELRVDEAVPVIVKTPGCLDSCTRDRAAKCSVSREGDKLVVTSEISWRGPEEIDKPCPGPCTVMEASCATPGLSAGKYTLVMGEMSAPLEVPSRLASPCAGLGAPRVIVSAPPPPTAPPPSIAAVPEPPTTGAPPTPPPPGDGLCIAPYGSPNKQGKASVGVTMTRPNPCQGASCTTAKPKCTIKRQGQKLIVTSTMPNVATAKPRKPCSEDCPGLLASCRIDLLPPGTYTVESGATTQAVQVPMPKEVCLP